MLHELLVVPAAITPVRGHVAGERDRRQDRERRAKILDDAGPNFGELRGDRCVETKSNGPPDRGSTGNRSLPIVAKIPLGESNGRRVMPRAARFLGNIILGDVRRTIVPLLPVFEFQNTATLGLAGIASCPSSAGDDRNVIRAE